MAVRSFFDRLASSVPDLGFRIAPAESSAQEKSPSGV
jgi:hypothetical protein